MSANHKRHHHPSSNDGQDRRKGLSPPAANQVTGEAPAGKPRGRQKLRFQSREALLDYVRRTVTLERHGRLAALFLDDSLQLVGVEAVDSASAPERLAGFAHRLGASGIILVRSQALGSPAAVPGDRALIRQLGDMDRHFDVHLVDFLVLGPHGSRSLMCHPRGGFIFA